MATQNYVRKDFRNTAHWVANLVTDKDGVARAEFDFPDDITTWRFTARGITADTMIGEVRRAHRTLLPLQVELALPRALREGDAVKVGAVFHNNSDKHSTRRAKGSIWKGVGAKQANVPEHSLILDTQTPSRMDLILEPTSTADIQIQARVQAADGVDNDTILKTLKVLPRGYETIRSYAGTLQANSEFSLDLGGELNPNSLKVSLSLESGLAESVESALDELIQYPYDCVEQTMSRFMPAVVANTALKKIGLKSSRSLELPAILNAGLLRLIDFQHEDGGWGWWKADQTNDFMTAYVLEGLSLCRDSGMTVPAVALEKAEKYLFKRVHDKKISDGGHAAHDIGAVDGETYAAHSLALYYNATLELYQKQREQLSTNADDILKRTEPLSTRSKALMADTFRLLNRPDVALKILCDLKARAAPEQTQDRISILTASALLEIGARLEPNLPLWQKMACKLIKIRKGKGWHDTISTAAAVRAISPLLTANKQITPVDVFADGKLVTTLKPDANNRATLTLTKELLGARKITLKPGRLESDVFWSAKVEGCLKNQPLQPQNPIAILETTLFTTGENAHEISPIQNTFTLKKGCTVKVRLGVTLTQPKGYIRISFPRPCGVELIRASKLKNGIVAFEEKDDGIHFFVDTWEKGAHEIEFTVRAEVAGTLFAPPPQFEPMYEEVVPFKVIAPTKWIITE
jgi:uncharacterized protein YfaS (alpha-2-macroglobulin family)